MRSVVSLLLAFPLVASMCAAQSPVRLIGTVQNLHGKPVPGAHLSARLYQSFETTGPAFEATADSSGKFQLQVPNPGDYVIETSAPGLGPTAQTVSIKHNSAPIMLALAPPGTIIDWVIVTAGTNEMTLDSPDPGQKVMVREELLDANPGRPGAPISIPGMPIETAAGGIKAPQYFVPGVAGDHGEPIAQYIAVGGYLAPNNLSANAHGNGYADPNIYISAALGSVATDGGPYNVLEGNHALNLAATYSFRPQLQPSLTLTGDYRDSDIALGFAPKNPAKKEWLAIEANYGNGLMRTLEHRKQFKWNALREWDPGSHEITLLSIGYWGHSHEGNLVPIGFATQVNDTLDPRQQDQTHTSILSADDRWKLSDATELGFSGFFRTFNLALFSNFGEGLIRQSEFRTVEAAEARASHRFTPLFNRLGMEAKAGLDYNEDDIRRDNLDHYLSSDAQVFGPFVKVLANDVTIREFAPFLALHGELGKHLHLYAGLRHENIQMDNNDLIKPDNSWNRWESFENPKATLTWTPGTLRWLPSASISIGQGFFTQDPRVSATASLGSVKPSPLERSHSEQLVVEKTFGRTDVRLTLGHTTTTANLGKLDADTGLAEDEGPGRMKYFTASAQRRFRFGMMQALISKADARDDTGLPTAEAPRTIFDTLLTLDKLPLHLHGRGEYEYVGCKFLDAGNVAHPAPYLAVPVGETRLALVRSFLDGKLELAANSEIARGYTGQTTETMAPNWTLGQIPHCAPGSGPSGDYNDFDCGTHEQAVGIRMVSWVGGSVSWRFGKRP